MTNRPVFWTRMKTVPVSHVFRWVRNHNHIAHACRELPRAWWHAKARELGYTRTWFGGYPLPFGTSTWFGSTYEVMEVDLHEMVLEIEKVAGRRFYCRFCGHRGSLLHKSGGDIYQETDASYVWIRVKMDIPDFPLSLALCKECLMLCRKKQSVTEAQIAFIRHWALSKEVA